MRKFIELKSVKTVEKGKNVFPAFYPFSRMFSKGFLVRVLLINCMVLNTIFNIISVTLWQPVHLSIFTWHSFNQYSTQYSFQATDFPT